MLNDEHNHMFAFRFKVILGGNMLSDTSFTQVSGIEKTIKKSEYQEGGENRFAHTLLEPKQHPNLVLIRGVGKMRSPLVKWCESVLEGDFSMPIEPKRLQVFALGNSGLPKAIWDFDNAFPVAWKIGQFNATKNELVLETVELSYNSFTRAL